MLANFSGLKYHLLGVFIFLFFAISGFAAQIPAPDLQCVRNLNNNSIELQWTDIPSNCGPFMGVIIFASNDSSGPFIPIDTITDQSITSFTHNGIDTDLDWFYYLEAWYDCPGSLSCQSDTLENRPPEVPEILSVSVSPNGAVEVLWEASPDPQLHYYEVSYFVSLININAIDTLYGANNNLYIDNGNFDPANASLIYTVGAFDSCNQNFGPNPRPHRTILLSAVEIPCESNVSLTWTGYNDPILLQNPPSELAVGWPGGVLEYRIFLSTNGSPDVQVGFVDSSINEFIYRDVNENDSLCFTVRAISREDTSVFSNSNRFCFTPEIFQPAGFFHVKNVTVNSNNQVELYWLIDTSAELQNYSMRTTQTLDTNTFFEFDRYPVPNPLVFSNSYIDSLSNPEERCLIYRIESNNECGKWFRSNIAKTIHLKGELSDFFLNKISWNEFDLDFATVANYNIYRNNGSGYNLMATVSANTFEFEDDVSEFREQSGLFCYKVEAQFNFEIPQGYIEDLSSFSNSTCIAQRVLVYVPEVFNPLTDNSEFKPVIVFGDLSNYEMHVFNRWGKEIFYSKDINHGWDGSAKGKQAPIGGYPFLITFLSVDGITIQKKGIVLLVK